MGKKLLDELDFNNELDIVSLMLDQAQSVDEIVIFGAGIGGKITNDILERHDLGHKVKYFSDNNLSKIGIVYCGKEVIKPVEIKEKTYGNRLILISSTAYDVISKQLVDEGIAKEQLYYFQPAGLSIDADEKDYIWNHIEAFEYAYNLLNDEKSRTIYRCILNYRISKRNKYLEELSGYVDSEENQYFDMDLLSSYNFETGFVDAGAYTGDTIYQMNRHFPKFSGEYFAFEAGKEIFAELEKNCNKSKYGFNVNCLNYAIWDEKGILKFDSSESGAGSRVSDIGDIVECNSLDNLLVGYKVDFIKMDIEGSERRAILGAEKIIEKNRPILAICIYHKREDFYDLPQLIESFLPNEYEFFIRQYRYGQSETVLYALPKSRRRYTDESGGICNN